MIMLTSTVFKKRGDYFEVISSIPQANFIELYNRIGDCSRCRWWIICFNNG